MSQNTAKKYTQRRWLVAVAVWTAISVLDPGTGWKQQLSLGIAFVGGCVFCIAAHRDGDEKRRETLTLSTNKNHRLGTFAATATYKGETKTFDNEDEFHAWLRDVGLRDR